MPPDRGSITDIDGIAVGHHHRTGRGWRTGTTTVIAQAGAIAGVDVRGGGPGTRETDALAPWNLVERIHAICLSGGSAYGLSAADGVMAHLEARDLGFRVGPQSGHVVPVVPTAVIFDLGRGGNFANRPDASFGRRAATAARRTERRRGSVGAGVGAMAGGLRGGVGTASLTVTLPAVGDMPPTVVTVGALCVVNARGSLVDTDTGLPHITIPGLRRPQSSERHLLRTHLNAARPASLNTTIGVVATDADLSRPEATRLAMSGHDGLARAIRPVHTLADGDTLFSMATGSVNLGVSERTQRLSAVQTAAADCVAVACVDALLAATSIDGATAYTDLCPSVLR